MAEPLTCGNCREPMQRLALTGHYGAPVEIDLCLPCHLMWFDGTEIARLPGPALIEVIGTIAAAQPLPHRPLRLDAGCARCRAALKPVHNQSRTGRSLQLECVRGHGAYHSFAQFLADKGLVRPLSSADRAALLARDGRIDCVGCGGPIGQTDGACRQCGALPSMFDIARLASALDPEGVTARHAVHTTPRRRGMLECPACGAPVPEATRIGCAHCGATLALTNLADVSSALASLAELLKQHAQKPAPEIVAKRLAALEGNTQRQREFAAQMEAEARSRHGDVLGTGGWGGEPALPRWGAMALLVVFALLAWWLG
jgi:hypothetical protein